MNPENFDRGSFNLLRVTRGLVSLHYNIWPCGGRGEKLLGKSCDFSSSLHRWLHMGQGTYCKWQFVVLVCNGLDDSDESCVWIDWLWLVLLLQLVLKVSTKQVNCVQPNGGSLKQAEGVKQTIPSLWETIYEQTIKNEVTDQAREETVTKVVTSKYSYLCKPCDAKISKRSYKSLRIKTNFSHELLTFNI